MILTIDLGASWTDAVLCLTCLVSAVLCLRAGKLGRVAALGLGIVGFAALVGTGRHMGMFGLIDLHDQLTGIAAALGVPLLGLAVVSGALPEPWDERLRLLALGVLPIGTLLMSEHVGYRTALGAISFVGALAACAKRGQREGAVGALIAIIAGLAIAGEGTWIGLSRTGWFHLWFALGLGLLATSAVRLGKETR